MYPSDIKKAISVLQTAPIFSSVSAESLENIVKNYSELISYQKGDVIFSRDSYRRAIGVVISGKAQVKKGKMPLSTHGSGDIFGAVTLFSDSDRYATDIHAASLCKVLFISREGILSLITESPTVSESYIAYLSNRIYFLNSRLESLTAGSIEENLLRYIRNNAVEENGNLQLKVDSYGKLAATLDVGRASLYRAMDSLTEKGIIFREDKKILLKRKDLEL